MDTTLATISPRRDAVQFEVVISVPVAHTNNPYLAVGKLESVETHPSLIPDMVDNGGNASNQRIRHTLRLGDTMIIKLYGDKAKQLSKELNLERSRGERVFGHLLPIFRLTSVEGHDIVEVILE